MCCTSTGFLSDAFVAGANKFVFLLRCRCSCSATLAKTDVRATFDGRYVLFCFVVTLVSILVIWALAKLFLKGTGLVGEFRSGVLPLVGCHPRLGLFLQSIYGDASMSSLMILAACRCTTSWQWSF